MKHSQIRKSRRTAAAANNAMFDNQLILSRRDLKAAHLSTADKIASRQHQDHCVASAETTGACGVSDFTRPKLTKDSWKPTATKGPMDYLEIIMNRTFERTTGTSTSSAADEQVLSMTSPVNNQSRRKLRNHENLNQHKPAEVFRKDLISAMKIPDTSQLVAADYWVLHDSWRMEWEKGVQVPVNPIALPKASFSLVPKEVEGDFRMPRKMIKCTPDIDDKETIDLTAIADSRCRYDLDELDVAWLQIYNEEEGCKGWEVLTECTLELVMEELEMQCHENMQVVIRTKEGLGIEYDESIVCDVCRSPECEEGNEMVFCDGCDLCVHQACYGILKVPEGSWLCKPCALGVRSSIKCLLCGKKAGAMKSTRSGRKWAHLSCALWIPEINIEDPDRMEPITKISHIPPSRWSLVCSICKKKNVGACIQCSVRNCVTAFHVTCALDKRYEMITDCQSSESCQTSESAIIFRSYCSKHGKGIKKRLEESPGKKRQGQSEEEARTDRQKRIAKLEEEFQSFVTSEAVVNALNVKSETAFRVMEYWTLRRKANFCYPLLNPKDCGKDLEEAAHSGLQRRLRMFMHLRQDLERVRNLCYMLGKREKIKRSAVKNMENVFLTQINYVERRMSVSVGFNPRILVPSIPKFGDPEALWHMSEKIDASLEQRESPRLDIVAHKTGPLKKKTADLSRLKNTSCKCEVGRKQSSLALALADRPEKLRRRKMDSSGVPNGTTMADSGSEMTPVKSPAAPKPSSAASSLSSVQLICTSNECIGARSSAKSMSSNGEGCRAPKRKIEKAYSSSALSQDLQEKRKRSRDVPEIITETKTVSETKRIGNKKGMCLVTRSSSRCGARPRVNSISLNSNETNRNDGRRTNSFLRSGRDPKIPSRKESPEASSCNINEIPVHVSHLTSGRYSNVSSTTQARGEPNDPPFTENLKEENEDQSKVGLARLQYCGSSVMSSDPMVQSCSPLSKSCAMPKLKSEIEPCLSASKRQMGLKWVSVIDDSDHGEDESYDCSRRSRTSGDLEGHTGNINKPGSEDPTEVPEEFFHRHFYQKREDCSPMVNSVTSDSTGKDLKLTMLSSRSFTSNQMCEHCLITTAKDKQTQNDTSVPAAWDILGRRGYCTCTMSTNDRIRNVTSACSSTRAKVWHDELYPMSKQFSTLMTHGDNNMLLYHNSQPQLQSFYQLPGDQTAFGSPVFPHCSKPSWAQPLAIMTSGCPLPIFYQYPPLPPSQRNNPPGVAGSIRSSFVQPTRSSDIAYNQPINSFVPATAAVDHAVYSGASNAEKTFCSYSLANKSAITSEEEQEWEVVTGDSTATSVHDTHRHRRKNKKRKRKRSQCSRPESLWSGKRHTSSMCTSYQEEYQPEGSSPDDSTISYGTTDMEISARSPLVIKVSKAKADISEHTPANAGNISDSGITCRQHSRSTEKLVLKINKKAIRWFSGPSRRKCTKSNDLQSGDISTECSENGPQATIQRTSVTDKDKRKAKLNSHQPSPGPNIKLRFKIERHQTPSLVHFKLHKCNHPDSDKGSAKYTVLPVASGPQQSARASEMDRKVMKMAPLRARGLDISSKNGIESREKRRLRKRKQPVPSNHAESKSVPAKVKVDGVPSKPRHREDGHCGLRRESKRESKEVNSHQSAQKHSSLVRVSKHDKLNCPDMATTRPKHGQSETESLQSSRISKKVKVKQEYCSMYTDTRGSTELCNSSAPNTSSFLTVAGNDPSTIGSVLVKPGTNGSKQSADIQNHFSVVTPVPQPTKHWKKRKVREHETQVFRRHATAQESL